MSASNYEMFPQFVQHNTSHKDKSAIFFMFKAKDQQFVDSFPPEAIMIELFEHK